MCIKIPINKIDEINKIKPIFFFKKTDFPKNIKKNKPIKITKELWMKLCEVTKFVIYDIKIKIKIPLNPISPRLSLKIFLKVAKLKIDNVIKK